MADRRLLLVHAHPDDESSQSSATMARYVSEGAHVTLVTCTLGELGEIVQPQWQHFTPEELGRHRRGEIEQALRDIGVTDHVFLGGVGAYHDSGMASGPAGMAQVPDEMPENAFWRADLLEVANHLVEIIRERRPQVAITYDPFGNYGHPDHIQAHRALMYASLLASAPTHRPDLGQPWRIQRVLWSTHNTSRWVEAYQIAKERGLELWAGEEVPSERFGVDPAQIVAVVDIAPWLDVCRKALAAHGSQVDPAHPLWQFFAIVRELPGAGEAYLLGAGEPFPAGEHPASDLFSGLVLDAS